VAAGIFGGLVAVTASGSIALACTSQATIKVTDLADVEMASTPVTPGSELKLTVERFYPVGQGSPIEVRWNAVGGAATTGTLLRSLDGPEFTTTITIPANARPGKVPFPLVISQFKPDTREPLKELVFNVYVKAAPSFDQGADGSSEGSDEGADEPTLPAVPADLLVATPADPAARPEPQAVPAVPAGRSTDRVATPLGSDPARPEAARRSEPTASVNGPLPTPATVSSVPRPALALEPSVLATAPAPSDLWTGLSAERPPSLLDAAPAPRGSGSAAGLGLFGLGMALTAAALAALRRPVLARRSRTR